MDWVTLAGIGKVETDHGRIFGGSMDTNGGVAPQILGPPLDGTGVGGNTTPLSAGDWTEYQQQVVGWANRTRPSLSVRRAQIATTTLARG